MMNIYEVDHAQAIRMPVSDIGASVGPGCRLYCFNILS